MHYRAIGGALGDNKIPYPYLLVVTVPWMLRPTCIFGRIGLFNRAEFKGRNLT